MLTNAKLQRMVVDRTIEPEKAAAIVMQRRMRQYAVNNSSFGGRLFGLVAVFIASLLGMRREN